MKKLFLVSNFSQSLNNFFNNLAVSTVGLETKLLAYRDDFNVDIESESFEQYLKNKKNYDELPKDINWMNAVISERLISNYSSLPNTTPFNNLELPKVEKFIQAFYSYLSDNIVKDSLVISGIPDNILSYICWEFCLYNGIQCLFFVDGGIVGDWYISDNITIRPIELTHEFEREAYDISTYNTQTEYDRVFKDFEVKKPIFGVISPNILNIDFLLNHYINKKKFEDNYMCYIDYVPMKNKIIANLLRIKNLMLYRLYEKKLPNSLPDYKYIYFPLTVQPESSTLARAPYYANMLTTLEILSKSIPLDYMLVTKEHPFGLGMRNIDFYKKVANFPNIVVYSSKIRGKDLIKNADIIITVGGTSVYEALEFKKKVVLLSPFALTAQDSKLIYNAFTTQEIFTVVNQALQYNVTDYDYECFQKLISQWRNSTFKANNLTNLAELLGVIISEEFENLIKK